MSAVLRASLSRIAVVLFAACIAMMVVAPSMVYANESSTSAQGLTLDAQSTDSLFESPDGLVLVDGITAGKVSYNAATKTLTLNGVSADRVGFKKDGTVTLNLVGTNYLAVEDHFSREGYITRYKNLGDGEGYEFDEYFYDNYVCKGSAIVTGSGSLSGSIYIDGALTVNKGSLSGNISCATMTMNGGVFQGDSRWDSMQIVCTGTLRINAGTVKIAESEFGVSAAKCKAFVLNGGTVNASGDIECESFSTTQGTLTVEGGFNCKKDFMLSGGTFNAKDSDSSISCEKLTVKGGSLKTVRSEYGDTNLSCASLSMSNGTVTGDIVVEGTAVISNGTIKGNLSSKKATIKGGTISGGISASGNVAISKGKVKGTVAAANLTMTGGTISASKLEAGYHTGIIDCGKLVVKGGKIALSKCDGPGIVCTSLALSKGSITVDDQYNGVGIAVYGGNLTMTGGSLKVTRSYEDAVQVLTRVTGGETYRGKTTPEKRYGGKAVIKGGVFTASVRKPTEYNALSARSFSYKSKCIKGTRGQMPAGFAFKVGGSTFKISEDNHEEYRDSGYSYSQPIVAYSGSHEGEYDDVTLIKFGGKGTAAKFNNVAYAGHTYSITGVAKNAFNTKQGAQLKSITFNNTIEYLGVQAFAGTKSLTLLRLGLNTNEAYKKGKLSSVAINKMFSSISKTAFQKCGKSNGAKLAVQLYASTGNGGVIYSNSRAGAAAKAATQAKYKALLVKYGLNNRASLKLWER